MTLQYKLAQPALSELFLERISFSQNNFQALFGVLWRKQRHVWNAHRTMHTRREGNEPSSSGFSIFSNNNNNKNDARVIGQAHSPIGLYTYYMQ